MSLQLKEEIELRKQMNVAELNDLDEATRLELEGFRTGTYLRLEIHNVPFEMVEHFDPRHPILVGGIGLGEENVGYMQVPKPDWQILCTSINIQYNQFHLIARIYIQVIHR